MRTINHKLHRFSLFSGNVLLVVTVLSLVGCSNKTGTQEKDPVCGLASPLVFTSDSLTLHLSDYFTEPERIHRIVFPDHTRSVKIDSNIYRLFRQEKLPPLSVIEIETEAAARTYILVKNLSREKVSISFDPGSRGYTDVNVRGSMNFWNAKLSEMHFADGKWVEEFELIPGEYQYLIIADGEEFLDPSNPDSVNNNIGGFNSLLKVGKYRQHELPFLRAKNFDEREIQAGSSNQISAVFAFWQNQLIESDQQNREITVAIPRAARKINRSWIRVIANSIDGGISNDLLIPLEYGRVVTDPNRLTRFDRQTMILYFMMVDRFKNGDTSNDEPVNDPEILPKANYFGGDLEGIKQVLVSDYFTDLGINTIWLSPLNQNPGEAYGLFKEPRTKFSGYHGYWPVSYKDIDYRFGTADEFRDLVERAHTKNMNILIDYVASHVHELHPVYRQHPEWVTELYLPDGTLNTERWEEYRLTTWFDTFLPKLDLRKPEVVNPLTDSAVYWYTRYGIDGFRHDATKHIDELYWRTLTAKLKKITHCINMPYQIGETYGSPELISSYVSTGMLDGQFDFNLYDDAVAVFARENESFERLQNSLAQSLRYYGYHNLMGNISGNQDRPRFISLAGGSLGFDEDSKYAGWTRDIGVGDSSAYDKLKLLHAFNLTIPGIPVIYYGDEYGMPGANDPDNRRMMVFTGLNKREEDLRSTVQKLTAIRSSNMALLFGDVMLLSHSKSTFAYVRYYFDSTVLVVFNKSTEPENIAISKDRLMLNGYKSQFGSFVQEHSDSLIVEMGPLSFDIITN